jgi:hypothetical protein
MLRNFKLHFFLSLVALISLLLFIFTNHELLGISTFIFCGLLLLLGLITLSTGFCEIKEIGEEKLILKRQSSREYIIPYNQIKCCVVYPTYRGANLDVNVKKNNKVITLRFGFWLAGDIFYSKINKLSEKCDVYVWRWTRFWEGKKRWTPVKLSSTWVPFEERDKK